MYIAVYVIDGSIISVETSDNFEELKEEMIDYGDICYRTDRDDLKIFSTEDTDEPVFSYGCEDVE